MDLLLLIAGLLFAAFILGAIVLALLGLVVGTVSSAWHAGKEKHDE